MKVLRKIGGRTLDTVSEDIRRICKIEEINTCVKRMKSEWNDHINRMTEHSPLGIARDK
jgi:hypothetical protein